MSQIKDIFFIKTILDRATAGSHNGETGYYSVSDNMFSEGHSCYCDNGNDYYSDLKGIFDCATTDFSCPGFEQAVLENGNYHMTIVKLAGVDHLTLLFGGITINLNFDGNYYYTQNNYASYGGTLYRFDYVDGEIAYVKTYIGGSYATVSENVETTLFSSASIMMYYSNADRDVNYAKINSEQGIGSGGWQVPNPNPTRKIIINGINYSQDEDGNMNKIVLNGVEYANSKGGTDIDFILNDVTIATPSQSPYTVTLDGLLPIGLYMMSTLIVEEDKIINQLINYTGGGLNVSVNGNTAQYTVSFTGQDVPNTQIQSTCTWGSWKTLKCKLSAVSNLQIY